MCNLGDGVEHPIGVVEAAALQLQELLGEGLEPHQKSSNNGC
jgi:hypothetical protein